MRSCPGRFSRPGSAVVTRSSSVATPAAGDIRVHAVECGGLTGATTRSSAGSFRRMDRLEDVVRGGESPSDLVFVLRGGVDTEEKLLRQASLLERRYTYGGLPARGISLFAARDDLDTRTILGTKLRTYPKYRQINGAALGELVVLRPTFLAPHWTALFQPTSGVARPEADLLVDLLGTLGPMLDNPKYEPTRTMRR